MTIKFNFWFGVTQMKDRFKLVTLLFALAQEFYKEAIYVSGFCLEAFSFQDKKAKKRQTNEWDFTRILFWITSHE